MHFICDNKNKIQKRLRWRVDTHSIIEAHKFVGIVVLKNILIHATRRSIRLVR